MAFYVGLSRRKLVDDGEGRRGRNGRIFSFDHWFFFLALNFSVAII